MWQLANSSPDAADSGSGVSPSGGLLEATQYDEYPSIIISSFSPTNTLAKHYLPLLAFSSPILLAHYEQT